MRVRVCGSEELARGSKRIVPTVAGLVAVFRLMDGTLVAIEDRCTHDGAEIASGEVEGDVITCPRHGARFCLRDGRVLSPPAYEDLRTFPVWEEAGEVFVEVA